MNQERKYVLASASPRRIEIMEAHGLSPLVIPAKIQEDLPQFHDMCETVMFLAFKKAQAVEKEYCAENEDHPIILAADTIVYLDDIMGKPKDKEDGFRMLQHLRGKRHFVVTGVCLLEAGMQNARVFAETTEVFFTDYSDEDILAYLDTEEAYDKAGGYAIQGYFSRYIDHIKGDYDNVVGFPWKRIEQELTILEH